MRKNLLETILFEPGDGFFLREYHVERLRQSAVVLGYRMDANGLDAALAGAQGTLSEPSRVRLTMSEEGEFHWESTPMASLPPNPRRVGLACRPVESSNPMLQHKTTDRWIYDTAKAGVVGVDDVILWNERGELTESSFANLVVRREGLLVTPPVRCGLLPGTFRRHLLERGELEEAVLVREDLERADEVFLINSVRKWMSVSYFH